MAQSISVKFTYGSSSVDFYDEEITELIVGYNRKVSLYSTINNYYGMILVGSDNSEYRTVDIDFGIVVGVTSGTLSKIETLYNQKTLGQPDILYCYYKYRIDPTAVIPVKMIRQSMKWRYVAGVEEADYTLPVSFVEVKPEGVGMIQFPMLQTLGNGT